MTDRYRTVERMSRSGLDRALWTVCRDQNAADLFLLEPDRALCTFDLTGSERTALVKRDRRWLLQVGANPFLVYSFLVGLAAGGAGIQQEPSVS